MDKARSGGLGGFGAAVVARGCGRGGVTCKSLDHGKIGTGIECCRHETIDAGRGASTWRFRLARNACAGASSVNAG